MKDEELQAIRARIEHGQIHLDDSLALLAEVDRPREPVSLYERFKLEHPIELAREEVLLDAGETMVHELQAEVERLKSVIGRILRVEANMGIYPAAYAGKWTERNDFQNGWNACALQYVPALMAAAYPLVDDGTLHDPADHMAKLMTRVEEQNERLERAQEQIEDLTVVASTAPGLVEQLAALADERDELQERLCDGYGEKLKGHVAEKCPTFYDGCHCTVDVLVHNIKRAEAAEAEVKRLREVVAQSMQERDTLEAAIVCDGKSTTAADAVGWMDSEGPVTVAPGRPKAAGK